MLKGVNKSVVEINNTDNDYIEKAILFIKPDKQGSHLAVINLNANKYLNSLCPNKITAKKPVRFLVRLLMFTANTSLGAVLMYIFLKIL